MVRHKRILHADPTWAYFKVTFGNKILKKKVFFFSSYFHNVGENLRLTIVNFGGFGPMKDLILKICKSDLSL